MEHISSLYQQYTSCGGNLSLQEIYDSCRSSIENNPDEWQSNDVEEAVKNLLTALVYIKCTPYSEIIKLAEESSKKRGEKYLKTEQQTPYYSFESTLLRKQYK